MSQTICRMYGSLDAASKAAAALEEEGFREVHVTSAPGDNAASGDNEARKAAVVEELMRAYVLKADALIYAPRILAGGTLVTVHAPFGSALLATEILADFAPIDSGVAEIREPGPVWEEGAPLSSALRIPVLLGKDSKFSTDGGIPLLSQNPTPLSDRIGMNPLSLDQDGTAKLLDEPAPLSKRLGLKILSSPFGTAKLLDNPAPLSSILALPVLIGERKARRVQI
jgi:hypothetical protein